MMFKELHLEARKPKEEITKLINYKEFCDGMKNNTIKDKSISVKKLRELLKLNSHNIALIDVRNQHEFRKKSINGATLFSLQDIKNGLAIEPIREIASKSKLYIYCKSGQRSLIAIKELEKFGINGINILGGIDAWNKETLS